MIPCRINLRRAPEACGESHSILLPACRQLGSNCSPVYFLETVSALPSKPRFFAEVPILCRGFCRLCRFGCSISASAVFDSIYVPVSSSCFAARRFGIEKATFLERVSEWESAPELGYWEARGAPAPGQKKGRRRRGGTPAVHNISIYLFHQHAGYR